MANEKTFQPPESWLDYVRYNVRANFETGELFWKLPMRGRNLFKPIGCKDSNGYIKVQIGCFPCYAHQVIFFLFNGYWPKTLIDHKDRNNSNNVPDNLTESNHFKNMMNSKVFERVTNGKNN